MAKTDDRLTKTSEVPPTSHPNSGTVDDRDTLKPGQWDRNGSGEIEDD